MLRIRAALLLSAAIELLTATTCAFRISGRSSSIPATTCAFRISGRSYDLAPLTRTSGQDDYAVVDDARNATRFFMNICAPVVGEAACKAEGGMICAYSMGPPAPPQLAAVLAKWGSEPYGTWSVLKDVYGHGVLLESDNGDQCEIGTKRMSRKTLVKFYCDEDAKTPLIDGVETSSECLDTFVVATNVVCGGASPHHGGVDRMSGGWIFVIVVVAVALLYVGIGVMYKSSVHGTRGIESIPHISQWRDVPGLVRDGMQWTWDRVSCKEPLSTGGGYSKV